MGWIAKRRKKQSSFAYLLGAVQQVFASVSDHRRSNACIRMVDVLLSGFAMFSLKSPSLLSFEKRSQAEEGNLQRLYRIDKICSDTQMREVLDRVCAESLQLGFQRMYAVLKDCRIVEEYRYWQGNRIGRWRGAFFLSHQMLSAVMVKPDKAEVFPLRCEPVIHTDGCSKNDSERNAAKRLLEGLRQSYAQQQFLLVADALYANGHSFMIGIQPDGNKSLFSQSAARQKSGQAGQYSRSEKGIQHHFCLGQ